MPNPLTDELTPEAKAELAATFAAMRRAVAPFDVERVARVRRKHRRDPWDMW
jgi:uncharacterized protein with von Willebrand factor type A (vWA) domain